MTEFVIRLKHLPDEADSTDIRKFFKKIEIPDGGVRILGGEKGVVYITIAGENGMFNRRLLFYFSRMVALISLLKSTVTFFGPIIVH